MNTYYWIDIKSSLAYAREHTLGLFRPGVALDIALDHFAETALRQIQQAEAAEVITVSFQVYTSDTRPGEQLRGLPYGCCKYMCVLLKKAKLRYQCYRDDTRELIANSDEPCRENGRYLIYGQAALNIEVAR